MVNILSHNSYTWVLIHIRAHANIHMGQVRKPRLSRYPTLPSTDSKTSHCSSTRPTYYCADILLHTHERAYIYINTYTHHPLYLVYLLWSNKSPRKQSISITYITILDMTYTHIFRCNFFFTAIAKLWRDQLFILSSRSVLVSFIVLCNLCRMQFCVCCILVTLAGIISPCRVSWSCWSALNEKLNKLKYSGKVLCCICRRISRNLVKPNLEI